TDRVGDSADFDTTSTGDDAAWQQRNDRDAETSLDHAHDRFGAGRFERHAGRKVPRQERIEHVLTTGRPALIQNQRLIGQSTKTDALPACKRVLWWTDQAPAHREQMVIDDLERRLIRSRETERDIGITEDGLLNLALVHGADAHVNVRSFDVESPEHVDEHVARQILARRHMDLSSPHFELHCLTELARALEKRERMWQEPPAL